MHAKPKCLGQVFLVNKNIQKKIIESADFKSNDTVLEIGSGQGELTRKIAPLVKHLVALELDKELYNTLREDFKNYKNVELINQDILKFSIRCYFKHKIKVIGNIPYYISTPIVEHLLKHRKNIKEAFLMFQKEFAQRLVAEVGSGKRGSLSCFVQFYTEPKVLFFIKKGNFRPIPKVDSAIVRLKIRKKLAVKVKNQGLFFKLIHTSFQQRRKTLRKSLKKIVPQSKLNAFFLKYKIDPNIRPQDLSLSAFAHLANFIQ